MSDRVVPNIICFQTQKRLTTLHNIQVLLKSVLIDLRGRNFVHAKASLRARWAHRALNLSSPDDLTLSFSVEFLNHK